MPHSLNHRQAGQGPNLVFIHGYLGGAGIWQSQLEALSTDFKVIVPELPGFGDSADLSALKSPVIKSIEDFAQSLLAFLSEIDIEQFHLVGHSMGGMIVQQMAFMAPTRVQKLICYGTGPVGILPNRFEPIQKSKERLAVEGVQATAAKIAANWYVQGAEDPTYPLCLDLSANVSLEAAEGGLTAMETWDGSHQLTDISAESLIIWGDQDKVYGWSQPEALWTGIPDCALAVIPNCGHNAHLEQPGLFNLLVQNFLV